MFLDHLLHNAPRPPQAAMSGSVRYLAPGCVGFEPESPLPGAPNLLLSCGIHGNETAPVEGLSGLLDALLAGTLRPRVRVLWVFGNLAALRTGQRDIEADLNRLFGVPGLADTLEARRAAELQQVCAAFFPAHPAQPLLHLDLHATLRPSAFEPFALVPVWAPQGDEGLGVAHMPPEFDTLAGLGMQAILLQTGRTPTFSAYTRQHLGARSVTLELGQAQPFGQNPPGRFAPLWAGITALLHGQALAASSGPAPACFRVAGEIIRHSAAFRWCLPQGIGNFAPLPAGALLAEDGDIRYTAPAEARIVFPNPTVRIGQRAGLVVVPWFASVT